MSINAYLIMRPVSGGVAFTSETADPLFKNWPQTIGLDSFRFSSSNPTSIQGAGKISFDLFTFTKPAGVNSPRFLQYCATSKYFDRVTLYITATIGTTEQVLEIYTFGTAFVMSITADGNPGDPATTETITMNYGQFDHHYYPYSSTGVRQPAILSSWSVVTNTSWTATPLDGPLSS
jgi:type VI protein secretion system component Hcp